MTARHSGIAKIVRLAKPTNARAARLPPSDPIGSQGQPGGTSLAIPRGVSTYHHGDEHPVESTLAELAARALSTAPARVSRLVAIYVLASVPSARCYLLRRGHREPAWLDSHGRLVCSLPGSWHQVPCPAAGRYVLDLPNS